LGLKMGNSTYALHGGGREGSGVKVGPTVLEYDTRDG
jgi:hypothetical protein